MSSPTITIQLPALANEHRAAILRAAQAALAKSGRHAGELAVALIDETEMRRLHRQHLGEDKTTDVLAFPAGHSSTDASTYLGDVVICLARAEAQARAGGHSLQSELMLLTAHGVLHLAGYDHSTERERRTMWQVQREALQMADSEVLEPPEV